MDRIEISQPGPLNEIIKVNGVEVRPSSISIRMTAGAFTVVTMSFKTKEFYADLEGVSIIARHEYPYVITLEGVSSIRKALNRFADKMREFRRMIINVRK